MVGNVLIGGTMLRILTALILSATFASVGLATDKKKMKDKKAAATKPADEKKGDGHGDAHGDAHGTEGGEAPKGEDHK